MGLEKIFHDLIFKYVDALRKMIQSLFDYVLTYCFWIYAVLSKFLIMTLRIRLFSKSYFV